MNPVRFILTPIFLGITFTIFYIDYNMKSTSLTKALTFILSSLALHELFIMYRKLSKYIYEPLAYPCLLLAFIANTRIAAIVFFIVIAIKTMILRDKNIHTIGLSIFFFIYISFVSLIFHLGFEPQILPYLFLFMVAANKGHDSFAYLTGKSIGKRPLTKWSPNKTVEGLIGGIIGGVIFGFLAIFLTPLSQIFPGTTMPLILSLIITLASSFADIFESMLKRIAKAKDSGNIIPEFGGFLDLMDSFFISVPVFYLVLVILGYIPNSAGW